VLCQTYSLHPFLLAQSPIGCPTSVDCHPSFPHILHSLFPCVLYLSPIKLETSHQFGTKLPYISGRLHSTASQTAFITSCCLWGGYQ
jgi:hypothetical protein